MLMVQQCAGQRGQRPAQAEIALGNKGLTTNPSADLDRELRLQAGGRETKFGKLKNSKTFVYDDAKYICC